MKTGMTRRRVTLWATMAFLVIVSVVFLFPIFWLVTSAFKSTDSMFKLPPVWIPNRSWHHVLDIIRSNHLMIYFVHSLLEAGVSTLVVLVLGTMMAFSLSRHGWRRRTALANFVLSLKIMPPVAAIIPVYLLMTHVGLFDTVQGMIIVYVMFNLPLATWLLLGFLRQVPVALDEAATIDGANQWQVLFRVILPLLKASLIGIGLVCFMFAWNDFFFAVSLTSSRAVTMTVETDSFLGDYIYQWASFYVAGALEIIPMLIIGVAMQRYLIRGLSLGAVAGA